VSVENPRACFAPRHNGSEPSDRIDNEYSVIRMFIRHPVEDYARWRQGYDDFDQERKGMG
jgi:hypothetical protein